MRKDQYLPQYLSECPPKISKPISAIVFGFCGCPWINSLQKGTRHKTRPEDHCRDYVVHLLIIVLNPRNGTAQNQARRSLPQFISCFNPDTEHKPIQGYIILTSIVLGLPLQHWQFLRNCLFREVHDVNPLQNYIWPFLASIHQMKWSSNSRLYCSKRLLFTIEFTGTI